MKVLIADKLPEARIKQIESLDEVREVAFEPKTNAEQLVEAVKDADVLVVRSTKVTAEAIAASEKLSLIIRAGAGVNTIDCLAASARGIYVANTPGKNAVAVAELAMGLILAMDRRIAENVADLRAGTWNKATYSKADGLFGKTLGVVGTGQIGREMIVRAKAFGLNVIAWSRSLTVERADQLGVGHCGRLEELFEQADIVSLHLAQTPETKGLISADLVGRMRSGAWLVNTARAGVWDEDAVAAAASAKQIRVATDLFSDEPEGKSGPYASRLGQIEGVYGTHHIGASTNQAQDAVAEEVVRILETYLRVGQVTNWVNRCQRTPSVWQLVVRHYDRPGVLANVLTELKSASINAQQIQNVIFDGAKAACCTIELDSEPTEATLAAIRDRGDEVISVELVAL